MFRNLLSKLNLFRNESKKACLETIAPLILKINNLENNIDSLENKINLLTDTLKKEYEIILATKDLEITSLRNQIELLNENNIQLNNENSDLKITAEKLKSLLSDLGVNF